METVCQFLKRYIESKLHQNHYKFLKFAESLIAPSDTCRNVVKDSQQNFSRRQSSIKTNFLVCIEIILGWRLISIFREHVLEFFSLRHGTCGLAWVGLTNRAGHRIIMITAHAEICRLISFFDCFFSRWTLSKVDIFKGQSTSI